MDRSALQLATTHLPLADVSRGLTRDGSSRRYASSMRTCAAASLNRPRIVVAESPCRRERGREEIDLIAPAIEQARVLGIDVEGPLPADTIFVPEIVSKYDAGWRCSTTRGAVLKYATFGHGVNVTLGLPFVRTSVDHGTALDLAGTGRAHAGSLRAALELASVLAAS